MGHGEDHKQHHHPGWDYMTASRIVWKMPCHLHAIIVTPDGTNKSYADVYNGVDTTSPKVFRIRCNTNNTHEFIFDPPLELTRGLYIAFETNLESCTVLTGGGTHLERPY